MRIALSGLVLAAAACNTGPGKVGDTDVPTPTDVGTPTINGTLDCEETLTVPPPGEAGLPPCVVHELVCGERYQSSNLDGGTFYTWDFWNDAMELGPLSSESQDVLDGPEAVFAFFGQPPDTEIRLTVSSCVQLWPSWRRHGDLNQDWCVAAGGMSEVGHFTEGAWRAKEHVLINRSSGDYDWEIIVDSWDGQVGNFTIEVECFGF